MIVQVTSSTTADLAPGGIVALTRRKVLRDCTRDALLPDHLITPLLPSSIFTTRNPAQEIDAVMQLQSQTPDPVPPNLPELPPILPETLGPEPEAEPECLSTIMLSCGNWF